LGAYCRHLRPIMLIDIVNSGEKMVYADAVQMLMARDHGMAAQVVWYDINCRYKVNFPRWATC
jgi:Kyakuja-Dileera-Zisupton transposase